MRYWIDRFEGIYAVLEDENKKMYNIPRIELPKEAKEGDMVILTKAEYRIDEEETRKRKDEIKERMNRLFE
ncbi:MAG: DUF3006 domain-containing protein [Lachnospiraceae bacterium]|nr:DUF3006 domain-containing protein [Lachnospiraceae bacterium]